MTTGPRHGVARTLSRLGLASRTVATGWVLDGRIRLNGRVVRDPEHPVGSSDQLTLDGRAVAAAERLYLMLNKPRGLVTTTADPQGRDTVYRCFDGAGLPWVAPVGRLDKASEGLLLFTNDSAWAARVTAAESGPDKTYHVQVDVQPSQDLLARLVAGIDVDGEVLAAKSAQLLRTGEKNAWLAIVLAEGRNRHIRRLLESQDIAVLRLVRVAIGALELGELPRGQWRRLTGSEATSLVKVL